MRPKLLLALSMLFALAVGGHSEAAPRRLALVIGNSKYVNANSLPNAANDARDVADALRRLKFDVVDVADAGLPAFRSALGAFTGKIQPGDTVLVFYAGHGLMGIAAPNSAALDNYLAPVDAAFAGPDRIPQEAVGLGALLGALDKARAGQRVLIIDACRDNPFAEAWRDLPRPQGGGEGLVQPSMASLQNTFIAFATSPGRTASDNNAGKNGLFTQEVLKRLETPGMTIGAVFEQAAASVETLSNGDQTPWFAAGGGGAANLVLNPAAGPAPVADVVSLDLRLVREAFDCGLPVCLESTAADVRSAALRDELLTRAAALRAQAPAAAAQRPLGPAPAGAEASLTAHARDVLRQQQASVAGRAAIGDRFMAGRDGFPKNEPEALRWYASAADAGSGAAAFAVASAHHRGMAGVARDEQAAYRWFEKASAASYGPAYGVLGDYAFDGRGGQKPEPQAAAAWWSKGAALNDGKSLRRLADMTFDGAGGLKKDPLRAQQLFKQAAEAGDPEAMLRVSQFILFSNNRPGPGLYGDEAEAHRWMRRAADLGLLQAYANVALDYHLGRGVAKDDVEALRWMLMGATRGSAESMYDIGMAYAKGDYGLTRDCYQAGRWLQRAQVAGSRFARLELNSVSKACERYS